MRVVLSCAAAFVVFFAAPWAYGDIGTMDVVPAATLLLPYFEADTVIYETQYDYPESKTVFTVTNVTDAPALAHVMLFTDFSVPSLCFDIELPAHGMNRIDLTQVFAENALELGVDTPTGNPPRSVTADAVFQDGFETGDISSWSAFTARISYDTLQAYHTGIQSSRTHHCAGYSYWDQLARGYVLIDVMNESGAAFPDEAGYFVSGGTGKAANTNALTGEYFVESDPNNFAYGNPMIAIEASGSNPLVTTPGNYTFYARYVAASAADNREPLASTWQARNLVGGPFSAGTHVLYWRDPKVVAQFPPCGAFPAWGPLNQASLTVFDEDGNSQSLTGILPFPLACGRVQMNSSELPGMYDFGWFKVNFNNVNTGILSTTSQGVIAVQHADWGRYSVGNYGVPTDNASDYNP